MYVHDWLVAGEPPVHPAGDDDVTVRVCVPFAWQAPHAEYVNDVHVAGGGGGGGVVEVVVGGGGGGVVEVVVGGGGGGVVDVVVGGGVAPASQPVASLGVPSSAPSSSLPQGVHVEMHRL